MAEKLIVKNLVKEYDGEQVLKSLSFEVKEGEFLIPSVIFYINKYRHTTFIYNRIYCCIKSHIRTKNLIMSSRDNSKSKRCKKMQVARNPVFKPLPRPMRSYFFAEKFYF